MTLTPGPGEPRAGIYRAVPFSRWLDELSEKAGRPAGRPRIITIDGRGASGKTTLAERMSAALPKTATVHTDDLAWHHSIMGWGDLLRDHILTPLRQGHAIEYRPPGWITNNRPGAISLPPGLRTVIIEGTGSIRRELSSAFDATIWIQGDHEILRNRGIDRDVETGINGNRAEATAFWDTWQKEEVPFLANQRPWDIATTVVAGTVTIPLNNDEIAVARCQSQKTFAQPAPPDQAGEDSW